MSWWSVHRVEASAVLPPARLCLLLVRHALEEALDNGAGARSRSRRPSRRGMSGARGPARHGCTSRLPMRLHRLGQPQWCMSPAA